MSTVDGDAAAAVTAKFLQARITALSTTLIKRLENIFAAALEEDNSRGWDRSGDPTADPIQPPSLTDTAVKQLQLDVESTALIRAAEDLMLLTRSMKELWLFGGLNTISDTSGSQFGITADERRQMDEDEQVVIRGIRAYLDQMSHITGNGNEPNDRRATTNGTHG